MPRILGCIKWRSNTTGLHYCEYYDTRTGKFMAIGMAMSSEQAEKRAASSLHPSVIAAIPQLAQVLERPH